MTATQQRTAMQQPVPARESIAPQLDQAAPWQPAIRPEHRATPAGAREEPGRTRTPLALAPAPIRRSGRGFVALCAGILTIALLAVLLVNITVANRQYDMVGLRSDQLDLTQSNERLRQQAEHLEAPQNLAAEASRMGMVLPGDIASIDLSTGQVSGASTAAADADGATGRVAAPLVPGERTAARDGRDEGAAAVEAPASAPQQGTSEPDRPADPADRAEAGRDLNGGTIPAPQFSASSTD